MNPPAPAVSASAVSLSTLAAEYWEFRLQSDPIGATLLGERGYDGRLSDITPAGHAREKAQLEALQQRLRSIDPAALGDGDRITARALAGEIESDLAQNACHLGEWTIDPLNGPQVLFFTLGNLQSVGTEAQGKAAVERWNQMGPYLEDHIANLRRGMASGKVATASAVRRVIAQLDDTLARPDNEWALSAPAHVAHPDWPAGAEKALRDGIAQAISHGIRPALQHYHEVLSKEILPQARSDDRAGVSHVPEGDTCYTRLIRVHTSLDLSAGEIFDAGMAEIEAFRKELSELGQKALGLTDFHAIQKRLRTDPRLYFATRDEVAAKAAEALARANAAFPRWVGRVPRTSCIVKRIEAHEEKDSTIGYYRQPSIDGTRPGTYYINTYAPETRPRYEAEVLAFHEAVPGHHSQIAIAQELQNIPEFRKHLGVTAYVEGWALYTERLADEMGLYSSDLDRIGMLSFSAWRAARLVVDTGMHAKGWSRQRAIDFMMQNTVLAENNIVNEVDRYITWPGQALAYKIGEREIRKLRAEAEERLGGKFDIKAFHDVLLENGAVSLPTLREQVERWVASVTTETIRPEPSATP